MTKIVFRKKKNFLWAFQIKGHSGFAEAGADIVCSGISVASQMALVTLKEVLKLEVESDIQDGYMQVKLLNKDEYEIAQPILIALEKTLEDISKNYKKNVKMEVLEDVY